MTTPDPRDKNSGQLPPQAPTHQLGAYIKHSEDSSNTTIQSKVNNLSPLPVGSPALELNAEFVNELDCTVLFETINP